MISVLMATYNGEAYVSEQIDSLLVQTVSDFVIYISDDCSTDSTWDILESYANKYPGKINLMRRQKNSGNAKHNFIDMIYQIKDDYLMLCDQDDIWLPNKIEVTLAKMKSMEDNHSDTPIIVHTDLQVVDRKLRLLNPSFKKAMNSDFTRTKLNQLLIQNTLTGCTCMYNRALANLLKEKPKYCVMHDWWIQLVTAAFGKIGHIPDTTVLYRQHGENVIGAKDVRKFSYKIKKLIRGYEIKNAINKTYIQAESFFEIYTDMLTPIQKDMVKQYCSIPYMGKLAKWHMICRLKTFKIGLSRNIAYFIFV